MIPANQTSLPATAYSLAIEAAERFAKRYHRLAFWVPFLSREFQIKAKMWDYTAERLRKHAQYLGTGVKSRKVLPNGFQDEGYKNSMTDISIPPRPEHLFGVGD